MWYITLWIRNSPIKCINITSISLSFLRRFLSLLEGSAWARAGCSIWMGFLGSSSFFSLVGACCWELCLAGFFFTGAGGSVIVMIGGLNTVLTVSGAFFFFFFFTTMKEKKQVTHEYTETDHKIFGSTWPWHFLGKSCLPLRCSLKNILINLSSKIKKRVQNEGYSLWVENG